MIFHEGRRKSEEVPENTVHLHPPCLEVYKNNKNTHVSMCLTFSPYKLKGIYFSLGASTQIKIPTFHLGLLQRHHILREQKHRLFKPKKQ